jgi:FHS family L-fucose permease-like MFS transporter
VGDQWNMSVGFVVPLGCFVVIAAYGLFWPKLSGKESLLGVSTRGH